MTKDQKEIGAFLVVRGNAIYRTSDFMNWQLVTGSLGVGSYREGALLEARFYHIRGLLSLPYDRNVILVADYYNYCIREINLLSQTVTPRAGKCRSAGFEDGALNIANIGLPLELILYGEDDFWFFDNKNPSVRHLHKDGVWKITTLYQASRAVDSIVLDPAKTNIYMMYSIGMSRLNIESETVIIRTAKFGHNDGTLSAAKVNHLSNALLINDDLMLVTDTWNNVIRLVNLSSSKIFTLCVPQPHLNVPFNNRSLSFCMIGNLRYIYHYKDADIIYILTKSSVYSLPFLGKYFK